MKTIVIGGVEYGACNCSSNATKSIVVDKEEGPGYVSNIIYHSCAGCGGLKHNSFSKAMKQEAQP